MTIAGRDATSPVPESSRSAQGATGTRCGANRILGPPNASARSFWRPPPNLSPTSTTVSRYGAATRRSLAGAAAGLLCGAASRAPYALVCQNDGSMFLVAWYGTAALLTAIVGAAIGRRVLSW